MVLSANNHHSHFVGTTNRGIFDWKHWVVILIVVTLVFGTKKLKNLGSDLGETIKGFRQAMSEEESQSSVQTSESQRDSQNSKRTIHVQATKAEELIQNQ
ncbi:Sec-independent protein translocase protein TatA [Pseudomonas fluorescens]|uniref:twin-arginine translocase TatA/TatE family subunit n=1 Tax=Pseudomonas fluorescens TaxID=294 RepID=UPI000FA513E2|nr:twin-arginine translocase TatA/TatE family subunit [Pseudomonas fluorescens]CAG8866276.1 Sec-independent protein translocase protein TatA [Pseudomonas fluorescens]VVN89805.1 Sec-independent protein translocase protein TatA [Pseudomonas fluorescens]